MNAQFSNLERVGVPHKALGRRLRGALRKLTEFIQEDEDFDS